MVHMADTSPDTSQRSGSKRSMDTSRHHHHGSGDPQDAGRLAKSRKVMPVFPSPKRSTGFSIDSLMSKEPPRGEASRPRVASSPTAADGRPGGSPDASPIPRGPAPHRRSPLTESPSPASRVGGSGGGVPPHIGPRAHHHQHQQHPHLSHHGNRPAGHPGTSMPGGHGAGLLGVHHGGLAYPSPAAAAAAAAAGLPHPAFLNGLSPAAMETGPGLHHHNPALEAAALAHLIPGGHAGHGTMFPGGPPGCLPPGFGGMPHGGLAGMPSSPHHGLNPHLLGLTQKDNFPFYTWLLSRHGNLLNRGFSGAEAAYLFPFRKAKRIRTAFSPSQLLRLEHAFEKNHYVVGQERKELAVNLNLTETQVKVWFQNRRTKHKRVQTEEGSGSHDSGIHPGESDYIDVESPGSPPDSPGSLSPPPDGSGRGFYPDSDDEQGPDSHEAIRERFNRMEAQNAAAHAYNMIPRSHSPQTSMAPSSMTSSSPITPPPTSHSNLYDVMKCHNDHIRSLSEHSSGNA